VRCRPLTDRRGRGKAKSGSRRLTLFPHHFPLEAASFLGPGAQSHRRLRAAGVADVGRCRGRAATKRQNLITAAPGSGLGVPGYWVCRHGLGAIAAICGAFFFLIRITVEQETWWPIDSMLHGVVFSIFYLFVLFARISCRPGGC